MKVLKFFGKFFGVIYSILYFFILISILFVLFASNLLKPNFYKPIIEHIDFSNIKISEINDEVNKDTTIEDKLVDALVENGVNKELAEELASDTEVQEVIKGLTNELINYYLGEGDTPNIKKETIKSIIERNKLTEIVEKNNIDLDKIVDELNDEFTKAMPQGKNEDIRENLLKDVSNYLDVFNKVSQSTIIYALIVFIVVSYLIIALLTWDFLKPLLYLGIPTLICGFMLTSFRFGVTGLIDAFLNDEAYAWITSIVPYVLTPLTIISLSTLIIGLAAILVYSFVSNKKYMKSIKVDEETIFDESDTERIKNDVEIKKQPEKKTKEKTKE